MRTTRTSFFRRSLAWAALLFLAYAAGSWMLQAAQDSSQTVYRVSFDGAVNPATARYIIRGIEQAEDENAQAIIVQMNTPGGLDASMREISAKMLASRVPVITYVAPEGARAASAGAIICLASNIIAMAPTTHIGAAHPVDISGKTVSEKITNDAAAYARTIAKRRGRNVEWAEGVVRKSISSTVEEAKSKGIVDIVASDADSLLRQLNGKVISIGGRAVTLRTRGAGLRDIAMNTRERFLRIIADPNIAYILMLIAIYGIIAELNNPGAIFPGVIGAIALILAFYALSVLQTNTAGIVLIILALAMFVTDLFVASHGALTAGGIVAFGLGSFMLFERGTPGYALSLSVLISGVAITSAFFLFIVGTGIRSLRNPVVTGQEGLVGKPGTARTDLSPEGKVFVDGTYWTARTMGEPLAAGDRITVTAVEGFTLVVKKLES